MSAPGQTLVVSNPPHGAVDAKHAAPLIGLLPVEMILKAHYPIPEIWLARDDPAAADTVATELRTAGLSVTITTTTALGGLPAQATVEAFSFTAEGLSVALDEQDLVLPYDLPVVVIACSPRDAPHEPDGTGAWGVFADIYADAADRLVRCGISATTTEFAALRGGNTSLPAGRLTRLLQECEGRFKRPVIDRRLMSLQLRRKQLPAPQGVQRKGFSFGTPALSALLQGIDAQAPSMGQCELGSRLVYLTHR